MITGATPDPLADLSQHLPKLAQPHWYRLIGSPVAPPSAPTPVVAKAQMREKKSRARRSLAKRGVAGFLQAVRAA